MPLKGKAKKVMKSMKDTYGSEEKAKEVFYATANKENRVPETWEKKASVVLTRVLQKHASVTGVNR